MCKRVLLVCVWLAPFGRCGGAESLVIAGLMLERVRLVGRSDDDGEGR